MSNSVRELNGYRLVYKPKHSSSMKSDNWKGYIYEHIYLMELELGRELSEDEVVHHLDGNRKNNRIENLIVLFRGMHARLHQWLDKGAPTTEKSGMNGKNSGKSKAIEPRYCVCGDTLQHKQKKYCSVECYKSNQTRKVEMPSSEELKELISNYSWSHIGRKYGVSDNSVRKWAKQYGLL